MTVTFAGSVRISLDSQTTLRNRREHCSLDPERLAAIGLVVGSQIRVRKSKDEVALYTVSETHQEANDTTVRMALTARRRLHTEGEFDATIDTQVPNPTLSDAEAQEQSEFVERLEDDGCQRALVALAPHGGAIERHTDSQAECLAASLGAGRASAWWCKGFRTGGGALEAWHITASAISDTSFPLLKAIASRRFGHAVAFHGFDEPDVDSGVLVGGAAPPALKREVVAAIECWLGGSGITVRVAGPGGPIRRRQPGQHRQPAHRRRRQRCADRAIARRARSILEDDRRSGCVGLPPEAASGEVAPVGEALVCFTVARPLRSFAAQRQMERRAAR